MIERRHSSASVLRDQAGTTDPLSAVLKRIERLIRPEEQEINTLRQGPEDTPNGLPEKTGDFETRRVWVGRIRL